MALVITFILLTLWSGSTAFDLIGWNNNKFIFGADYYPEAWPPSMWETDALMMQKAGINFVRMAEFSWVKMEPSPGKFNFTWLDAAIAVLAKYNIYTLIGTPTASVPAWLVAEFPEIQVTQLDGVPYRYGTRGNRNIQDPNFINATTRIVTAIAKHYSTNPYVIGYQLDNEVSGPTDYSATTQAAFQKYISLDALNDAWGTVFWGHTYMEWSEVPLAWNTLYNAWNPSLYLDFYRFNQEATRSYLQLQIDIITSNYNPKIPKVITTNMMGLYLGLDYADLSTALDFSAWDNYPMLHVPTGDFVTAALSHDLIRSTKHQNHMVMEQQAGLGGWQGYSSPQPPAAVYRLYAYQAIAHGADGVTFFRWRTSRFGTEQYWQGILDADSYPNSRYQIIAQMGAEIPLLTPVSTFLVVEYI